ncbi:hypothetical protein [Kitasatospora griseola]|uniref:hypothetical protein n=1 Tax=Kitasatospora griseola TaxID=2064 RepID=UPI0019107E46|nr:hypothetical protein [Kitasatospora griseola]
MIDPDLIGDPNGYVPGEAVQGVWRVGRDGKLTGEFVENPNYGAPKDDFARLADSKHWLDWLGPQPAVAVRDSIAGILDEQVSGAILEWIKITDVPRYLTGGRPQSDDKGHVIVTRAGIALPFALSVASPGRKREILQGTFSWVAVNVRPAHRWQLTRYTRPTSAGLRPTPCARFRPVRCAPPAGPARSRQPSQSADALYRPARRDRCA